MLCSRPLLSLSHWLLLFCPNFFLFLKNLLSSSPQSSSSETPQMWGWCHLLISYFFIPQEELACTYGVLLCGSWTYAQRFHTKSVEEEKQYLFIPDKSYSPFILPQTKADLLSARQLEYKLRSHCLPYRARGVKFWRQLTRPWRVSPEGVWVPPPTEEILTNSHFCHLPPQTSVFISFVPSEEFVPRCCGVLWPCRDMWNKHFSVSQFQLRYLRLWH